MNNIYQEQYELTVLSGCESWEEVKEWFDGMTVQQIKAEADRCWPSEENNLEFAQRVFEAL